MSKKANMAAWAESVLATDFDADISEEAYDKAFGEDPYDPADLLGETSIGALLKAFASLTHQMHESSEHHGLREQRNLIEAEIVRRAGA